VTAPSATSTSAKPYKGPESYQTEDAHLFYGRDDDAEELVCTILSNRLTLLHAQSGSGKTSLLNARVIPRLEARNWIAVRATPLNDPVEAVKQAALQYLLPPPLAESEAIRQACSALLGRTERASLQDLLRAFGALPKRDPLRRTLIARIRVPEPDGQTTQAVTGDVTPFFTRLLRGTISAERFMDHVAALLMLDGNEGPVPPRRRPSLLVEELLTLLESDAVRSAYHDVVWQIRTYPIFGLRPFFENLMEVWGRRHPRFAIVLILDQFEELFTRYVDTGATTSAEDSDRLDWRLRVEFFNELGRLYGTDGPHSGEALDEQTSELVTLPIRYVISIRNEYVGLLDDVRRMVTTLEDASYHLTLLQRAQAEEAIRRPAVEYGYDYEPGCFKELVDRLTKEDRFVEPGQLQIVCEKLWQANGQQLIKDGSPKVSDSGLPLIDQDALTKLGGIEGIVEAFVQDFLGRLSEAERFEVLDMLEPLITNSGTRNLAEWNQLARAPFRDPSRREKLLRLMIDNTIIRVERRPTGRLVEITHEFLIPPIRKALATLVGNARLREALRSLVSFRDRDFRADSHRGLSLAEVENLDSCRDQITWPRWATELMLRSAVAGGAEAAVIRVWSERFDQQTAATPTDAQITRLLRPTTKSRTHSLAELRLLNEHRDSLTDVDPNQARVILRSELLRANDAEAGDIVYWTRRSEADVDKHPVSH
jgi:hypothetical protein